MASTRRGLVKNAFIVRGTLVNSRLIELDEAVPDVSGAVEVVVRPAPATPKPPRDVLEVIASLRGGTRTKEEIDRETEEERASWDRQ